MCFSNLQISKKKYSKSLSWTWNVNFPPITLNYKFKFQAQVSNLEYFCFGNLEIWKTNHSFWKKTPLFIESTLRSVGNQIAPFFIFFKSCIICRSAKMPQQVATISMPTIRMVRVELLGTCMYCYMACNCMICNLLLLGKSHFLKNRVLRPFE